MTKTNLIMETYFSGNAAEWLNQIPESIIDRAIKILEIDPDKEMIPKGYMPFNPEIEFMHSVKGCLWADIVRTIHRWGMPTPSQMHTSPAKLKKHANDIKRKLSQAVSTLESLKYSSIFEKGTMTKEFIVGDGLRDVSEVLRANKEGNNGQFVSPLIVKQEYESKGEWAKYYPFDHDLENALNALENIIRASNHLLNDPRYNVAERGKNKKGKDSYDSLVCGLCHIYRKYTGEVPVSSAREDGTATGNIRPVAKVS